MLYNKLSIFNCHENDNIDKIRTSYVKIGTLKKEVV